MSGPGETHIDYDSLLQDALRGMIPSVLAKVADHGLPGEHHFYIGFSTRFSGVHISDRLLKDYPQEMVIVLRNQFQDLRVEDSHFEVTLFFGGIPETLTVPYKAVKRFEDPSSEFALSFTVPEPVSHLGLAEDLSTLEDELLDETNPQGEEQITLLSTHLKGGDGKPQANVGNESKADTDVQDQPVADESDKTSEDSGAKVVSLDQFRKA